LLPERGLVTAQDRRHDSVWPPFDRFAFQQTRHSLPRLRIAISIVTLSFLCHSVLFINGKEECGSVSISAPAPNSDKDANRRWMRWRTYIAAPRQRQDLPRLGKLNKTGTFSLPSGHHDDTMMPNPSSGRRDSI
jgi:hypothetical protein